MPSLIYGTAWKKERTQGLVERALALGYRGIDTACQPKHYDEAGVGAALRAAFARGLERREVYVQTKFTPLRGQDPKRVPYDPKANLAEQVRQSVRASLKNLQTEYLDAILLHSPLPRFEQTLQVWREFEALRASGGLGGPSLLGLSNCHDLETLTALHAAAEVKPSILQNRFYADTAYDTELRLWCGAHSVVYQSFWTLSANPHLLAHSTTLELAKLHGVSAAQVLFRGLIQLGVVPLTGTTNETHMQEGLASLHFTLSDTELERLRKTFEPDLGR
jgi:diketogulonate reductase-like aldo/keto reductase